MPTSQQKESYSSQVLGYPYKKKKKKKTKQTTTNVAKAFTSCFVQDLSDFEWYLDSRTMTHMTRDNMMVEKYASYIGNVWVLVSNVHSLTISRKGLIS